MTLINHPEYNSSLILRSEVISDHNVIHESLDASSWIPSIKGYTASRNIHRLLLPRRPGRDGSLEQDCTFYHTTSSLPSVLVLTPRLAERETLPYYHPAVANLAFRYATASNCSASETNHILIEIVPLNTASINLSSRIYRTCLALLETLDRYGWGAATNYQKRVSHDVLVPRNTYQDLYLVLKERHKSLADSWYESTDPCKHVFEVIR
jgi:tRNASer (uridine44-2'-O)-methyltransferase